MFSSILNPVLALIIWSLLIWILMYSRRLPAMKKAGIDPQNAAHPGSLDSLPAHVRASADNYNHLHEQPTVFYALAYYLHLTNPLTPIPIYLAWGYVALRVLHSLTQITINKVVIRFVLFSLSSLTLIAMALWAALNLA